jgi:hypothetical protein
VIFVVLAPLAAGVGIALSARMALCVQPTHHHPVERLTPLDIRQVAGVGDFLVAAAPNETRETAVLARWQRAHRDSGRRFDSPPYASRMRRADNFIREQADDL